MGLLDEKEINDDDNGLVKLLKKIHNNTSTATKIAVPIGVGLTLPFSATIGLIGGVGAYIGMKYKKYRSEKKDY